MANNLRHTILTKLVPGGKAIDVTDQDTAKLRAAAYAYGKRKGWTVGFSTTGKGRTLMQAVEK